MFKRIRLILILCLGLVLFGCNNNNLEAKGISVEAEPKFGGVYIHLTIEEFCDMGFEYGDSLDIKFSNGFELNDIPFYNGYYTRMYEPLLVAYPGYPYIDLAYNNGSIMYEDVGIEDGLTVDIKLNQRAKYLSTQQSLAVVYTNDRGNYDSDVIFANFRVLNGGSLKSDLIYRSASPCDNSYNRASYVDDLVEVYQVNTIIDLADDNEEIVEKYNDASVDCSYWRSLYDKQRVFPLGLNANFSSDEYKSKVKELVKIIIENDGPYLIHCVEGKDRTGFVCALIEALANFSYEEIENDYMKTYDNYYGINKNKEKYDAIVEAKFKDIINYIYGGNDSLLDGGKNYLLDCGLSNDEIDLFILKINDLSK